MTRKPTDAFRKTAFLLSLAGALALFVGPAALKAESGPSTSSMRLLTMSGEGEARGVPDQAELSAGVVSQGATAADALAANNRAMNNVFAALKHFGIPEKSIRTSNFSVSPQYPTYRPDSTEAPKIVGYQVSNNVTVTVSDIAKVGPAIDALVSAGANQLNGVNFSFANPKTLMAQARTDAVKDAQERAQTYAHAAGVTLGPIMSIQEGGAPVMQPLRMTMAASAEKTTIAAGEQSVNANVTIVWQIR